MAFHAPPPPSLPNTVGWRAHLHLHETTFIHKLLNTVEMTYLSHQLISKEKSLQLWFNAQFKVKSQILAAEGSHSGQQMQNGIWCTIAPFQKLSLRFVLFQ